VVNPEQKWLNTLSTSTRHNHKSGHNATISPKMGLPPCFQVQYGPYGCCLATPPTTIPHFIGAVCLVTSPDSFIGMFLSALAKKIPIFVHSQRLIARNVHELFSSNRGVSHFYEACCIEEVSREFVSFRVPKFSLVLASVYRRLAS
jgi:hypothetical protein